MTEPPPSTPSDDSSEASSSSPLVRGVVVLIVTSLSATLIATLWFVVSTIGSRTPYWGEAEVIFEASRLRQQFPLYVDPFIGAHEYGAVPSRFYVTYPPLWAWVLSRVGSGDGGSSSSALLFGRLACSIAWFGSLATIALTAKNREMRRVSLGIAAFIAGIWVLANFATVGRPDSIACAIAAIALARSIRDKKLDDLSVLLFVLVPWVKPTIVGLPIAAIVGSAIVDRERTWRVIRTAFIGFGASFALAHFATHGALLMHVIRSNAQPFTLEAWLDQVPARLPFFAPLFLWALVVGYRERADRGMKLGLIALCGAIVWTMVALAKTGSSSNYWMEPSIAAILVLTRADAPLPSPVKLPHALLALIAVLWADVGSFRAAFEHSKSERTNAAFVSTIRQRCGALSQADVVMADEAGIELALNQRIITPTYQMVHLVRRGIYPAQVWTSDLESPAVRCLVEHTNQMRLSPDLSRSIDQSFTLVTEESGFRVWRKK